MRGGRKTLLVLWLLAVICLGRFSGSNWALAFSRLQLDVSLVPWTKLSFEDSRFLVTVTSDVELIPSSRATSSPTSMSNPKVVSSQLSSLNEHYLMVNTIIDPIFRAPVELQNKVWFDPRKATAHRRFRLRLGEDDFLKKYWFTRNGVFRFRREPEGRQEALLPPEEWTDVRETFYPYDLPELGCPTVSEASLLIYVVSAAGVFPDHVPITMCVFGKRQLHKAELRVEGLQPIKINYLVKTGHTELRREGTVQSLKITLEGQSMEKGSEEEVENFSFLGFRKDIVIYLDPVSRIPIRVSADIPTVGKANLNLREVRLKQ
jgi:hypothetical protein